MTDFGKLTAWKIPLNFSQSTFEEMDTDENKKVSQEEFTAYKESAGGLDVLELSTLDLNGDGELSWSEAKVGRKEAELQEILNSYESNLENDFDAEKLPEAVNKILDYVKNWVNSYTGKASTIADDFKVALQDAYDKVKNGEDIKDPEPEKDKEQEKIDYKKAISNFEDLDIQKDNLDEVKNYNNSKLYIMYSDALTPEEKGRSQARYIAVNNLTIDLKDKFTEAVKKRFEEAGLEYTDAANNAVMGVLGDAISEAVDNNLTNELDWTLGRNWYLDMTNAVEEVTDKFNANFKGSLINSVNNDEIVKDSSVDNVDKSKVQISVKGKGINVNDKRREGEDYLHQTDSMNITLQDLINGTKSQTVALVDFGAYGKDFSKYKTRAIANVKSLIHDISVSMAQAYDSDLVTKAEKACISYYSAAINAMQEPSSDSKHTTRMTAGIQYENNGKRVTETISYYTDNHAWDSYREGAEKFSDNSTGLQAYRDGTGQTDFFITVDLSKVVQNFYRFL